MHPCLLLDSQHEIATIEGARPGSRCTLKTGRERDRGCKIKEAGITVVVMNSSLCQIKTEFASVVFFANLRMCSVMF